MVELMCPGCRKTIASGQPYCPDCLLTPVTRPPVDDAAAGPAGPVADETAAVEASSCGDPDCPHGGTVPAAGCRSCGRRPAARSAGAVAGAVTGATGTGVVLLFPWGAMSLPAGRTLRVGREDSPLADELASYSNVSRRHAEIAMVSDVLVVTDLDSVNGTFVNDRRIAPGEPVPLRPGDRLRFASTLVVRVEGGDTR